MAPNSTERRPTQAERRNKSERALLDAAARLIAEVGVEQASLARIGQSAGASSGLASHHFGSKDALVARLARQAQDRVVDATRRAWERSTPVSEHMSALDILRLTLRTYLELFEHPTADERALIVMWGATFPSEASIEGMLEADQRSYDGWAELIRHGQDDGSICVDLDPAAAAVVLFGLMRGVAALLLTDSDINDMRNVRATCDAWIIAALARMEGPPATA